MLREIGPDDPAFIAALASAELPTDDLTSEPFRYFTWDGVAFGGVGDGVDALIRSIIVLPRARRKGYGVVMIESLANEARDAGVERLWLLTTSAATFFESLGWRSMDRADAPAAISKSRQFGAICPASAVLMARTL